MAALGAIFSVVGTIVSAVGTIAQGRAQKAAAYYEADQLDLRAKEERAAGQREAFELGRQKDLILSRQQAVAAASGGGALDPTVLDLQADVVREGGYREALVQYGAEERAKGTRAQATGMRLSGDASQRGARYAAFGTLIGGFGSAFGSFYDYYGRGRPTVGGTSTLRYG